MVPLRILIENVWRIKKSHSVSVTYSDSSEHDPNIKMMNSPCIKRDYYYTTTIRCGNSNLLKSLRGFFALPTACIHVHVVVPVFPRGRGFCFFNKLLANQIRRCHQYHRSRLVVHLYCHLLLVVGF